MHCWCQYLKESGAGFLSKRISPTQTTVFKQPIETNAVAKTDLQTKRLIRFYMNVLKCPRNFQNFII